MKQPTEDQASAAEFGRAAMMADDVLATALKALIEIAPQNDDAIMSGAMVAITRFAIQQLQAEAGPVVVTTRDVVGYFIPHVQRAGDVLLTKPAQANA